MITPEILSGHFRNSRHRIGEWLDASNPLPLRLPSPRGTRLVAKVRLGGFTGMPAPRLPIVLQVNPTQVEPARAASPKLPPPTSTFRDLTHTSSVLWPIRRQRARSRLSRLGFLNEWGDSIP
jgi:hypothetical protein